MAYQEVKKISYGSKVKDSIKGLFIGPILIIIATIFIFVNENRAIKQYKANDRAQGACVEMSVDQVNQEFTGKIVHCTGIAHTNEILSEGNFGINVNGFRLTRDVEYYQVIERSKTETKEKLGGGTEEITTYYYEKEWTSSPQDNDFKDPDYVGEKNFVYVYLDNNKQMAENVSLGAFKLPEEFISSISGSEPIEVKFDSTLLSQWNASIKKQLNVPANVPVNYVHSQENVAYFGNNPESPQVGDVRVTFYYTPNDKEISLVADVDIPNKTFAYHTDAKNGKTVGKLMMGNVSAEQMFEAMNQENKIWTWIFRIIILLVIVSGFKQIFSVASILPKLVPFLGKGVEYITGFIAWTLGLSWTFLFIGIAWITVRPALSIPLLAIAIGLIVFFIVKGKKKAEAAELNAPVETETLPNN